MSLRERKKQRTHDAISGVAISLFLAHGFDRVSVADIAAAAEISKPTLFRYFRSKEELLLHRIADHQGEAARVVRDRAGGQSPVAALEAHFLDGLERRDPVTGLNDVPEVLAFHNLIFSTPSLAAGVAEYVARDEDALAAAIGGSLTGRLAAAQIIAVQRVLARENWSRLNRGETADEMYAEAVRQASAAYRTLQQGMGSDRTLAGHPGV
ncbi:TetR family transcriptional regulator [Actinoplanes derwentensis]|uniref:DNA-binding transcriptional regulator, AcrR family n=1 Tax=Actinoplanes derwentensis TaxID=113562 RepID=A0A1H1VBU6_9ACTN|nr:TetR family transcriptional regulator [Actinoplanes derwentensis]GID83747.1 TetR family transcriptional regulator [Actinoplanes derwentensis]SDS82247.1 DNA-binding transcriptional regulator, AcrR family [Actinoplanes derwentensis]